MGHEVRDLKEWAEWAEFDPTRDGDEQDDNTINDTTDDTTDDAVNTFGNYDRLKRHDGQDFKWPIHAESFFDTQYKDSRCYPDGMAPAGWANHIYNGRKARDRLWATRAAYDAVKHRRLCLGSMSQHLFFILIYSSLDKIR